MTQGVEAAHGETHDYTALPVATTHVGGLQQFFHDAAGCKLLFTAGPVSLLSAPAALDGGLVPCGACLPSLYVSWRWGGSERAAGGRHGC